MGMDTVGEYDGEVGLDYVSAKLQCCEPRKLTSKQDLWEMLQMQG